MELNEYLQLIIKKDASDLYLSADAVPSLKVHGKLVPIGDAPAKPEWVKQIAYEIMNDDQIQQFESSLEMNLAMAPDGIGRFRVNIFQQRNNLALVIRNIKTEIPSLESLGVPEVAKKLIMQKRGLVLFVGATSTGKSTSLASLIDYRNERTDGHIITVEDPIEYIHTHKKSIVNQREVGLDTHSYDIALKNTLRQAPDVILMGEIRSRETMEYAIAFSETGHLCLSTLHATNANQALDRIINFFPEDRRQQLLLDLSLNLVGFISQRLIPAKDGSKRILASEVLLGTPLVKDLIYRGEIIELKDVMEKSENLGMQTFDSALFKLYNEGQISYEDALRNADSANNLRLKISLKEGTKDQAGEGLTLQDSEEVQLDPRFLDKE